MFNDPISILALVGALVVLGILLWGFFSYAKGGEYARQNSNKIMRWRLAAQFIAVLVVIGMAWLESRG
ncbi:twin transmembrane helix small protein [Xinfangfangia sp. CPCC 101601]|uniref:Twin transmembrane helix small protein n=1 Tax=Pseudogemmobacter lacusdianii TaxID=3069608 RepID=A0ABU0VXC6_9RHOB|nr:twin transmembrane helix small protein [Xinfangfangia sp. CPCC 101601]MDQ2066401.1 twin transmembrane helix small protein [Xinfangfangia sp. CPCC 101601]